MGTGSVQRIDHANVQDGSVPLPVDMVWSSAPLSWLGLAFVAGPRFRGWASLSWLGLAFVVVLPSLSRPHFLMGDVWASCLAFFDAAAR
jgi:hypothetical protein